MAGEAQLVPIEAQILTEQGNLVLSGLKSAVEQLGEWEEAVNDYFDAHCFDGHQVPEGLEELHSLWVRMPEAGEWESQVSFANN